MSYSNQLIRWTVAGRWIATVGIGIVVALGYALFQPAYAQNRGPQSSDKPTAAAEKNSAAPGTKADGGESDAAAPEADAKGGKRAARKGPCRERNACPGRPESDGAPSFFLISKCMVKERERVRHKDGRADPLDGPESNKAGCL